MTQRIRTGRDYSKYQQGAVVEHWNTHDLGHIVGFDRVHYDHGYETILNVLWDDGEVRSIHPGNVTLL